MNRKEAAQIYRKAADVLDERGWCQGTFFGDNGGCCASGALMVASGYDSSDEVTGAQDLEDRLQLYYLARGHGKGLLLEDRAVHKLRGSSTFEGLVGLNDRVGTTKEQVQQVLREVATALEATA